MVRSQSVRKALNTKKKDLFQWIQQIYHKDSTRIEPKPWRKTVRYQAIVESSISKWQWGNDWDSYKILVSIISIAFFGVYTEKMISSIVFKVFIGANSEFRSWRLGCKWNEPFKKQPLCLQRLIRLRSRNLRQIPNLKIAYPANK